MLCEKGIGFEARLGVGSGDAWADETFAEASPRGAAPALIDGGTGIFGSRTILEYLDERWPDAPMLPAEPAERAGMRMLADVMDSHYEPNNWALGEVTWFERARGRCAQDLMDSARRRCEAWFAWLEKQLGERKWFNGASFGYGDL